MTSAKNIWIQKLFLHVCGFLRFDCASVRFLFLELKKGHWEITKGIMSAHFLVIKKGLLSNMFLLNVENYKKNSKVMV